MTTKSRNDYFHLEVEKHKPHLRTVSSLFVTQR